MGVQKIDNQPAHHYAKGAVEGERVKLADGDIKVATFSKDGTKLAIGLETGEVQMVSW